MKTAWDDLELPEIFITAVVSFFTWAAVTYVTSLIFGVLMMTSFASTYVNKPLAVFGIFLKYYTNYRHRMNAARSCFS